MGIWFGSPAVADIAALSAGTLNEHIGIEFTHVGEETISASMPVDPRTVQPAGVLHGGASVVLAETLASVGGYLTVDPERFQVFGQEINANHVRPGLPGQTVHGTAAPLAIGRRSQVWEIKIVNDDGKLVCVSRCTLAVVALDRSDRP